MLIFRVGHLGDTVIALPALWAIRSRFPDAHITLLSNLYADSDRVSPDRVIPPVGLIDDYLKYPSHDGSIGPLRLAQLWRSLRKRRYDALVYLAPRLRQQRDVRRDLLFFKLSGIQEVIGQHGFATLPSRKAGQPLPACEHEVDHLLRRLSLSDVPVPAAGNVTVELALTDQEIEAAKFWLRSRLPAPRGSARLVGFGPGSKWPSKVWPLDRFAEVGRRLIQEENIYPIVFGGSEDRLPGQHLLDSWGRGALAAGELSVRQSASALAHCRLYIGNDTGTMHLAAAVSTPCVVPMSALDWPGRWNPYGRGHTVFRRPVSCEGCLLEVCTEEGLRCLLEISAAEVLTACKQTLAASEPATAREIVEIA